MRRPKGTYGFEVLPLTRQCSVYEIWSCTFCKPFNKCTNYQMYIITKPTFYRLITVFYQSVFFPAQKTFHNLFHFRNVFLACPNPSNLCMTVFPEMLCERNTVVLSVQPWIVHNLWWEWIQIVLKEKRLFVVVAAVLVVVDVAQTVHTFLLCSG